MMLACVSAICLFVAAGASASTNFDELSRQAQAARDADQGARAVTLYKQALKLKPAWTGGWWSLGTLLYSQERFSEAASALEHVASNSLAPSSTDALLALCDYETGEYGSAEKHLERWASAKPPTPVPLSTDAFFHWALILTRSGQFERALVLLNAQAKQGHVDSALIEAIGIAALRIPAGPGAYPPFDREPVWIAGRATLEAAERHFPEAESIAKELLLHYATHPNVPFLLGNIYLQANDLPTAEKYFRQELAISPDHIPALVQVASSDLLSGNIAEALAFSQRAVAAAPKDFIAHAMLGKALLAAGQKQKSVRELEFARDMQPRSIDVHWALARAYLANGRETDATRERTIVEKLKGEQRKEPTK